MRTEVDTAKLDRLRDDLIEWRATLEGLSSRYQRDREYAAQCVAHFRADQAGRAHFRNGDEPALFLALTPAQQAECPREVTEAREIQQIRTKLRELQARIEALRPCVDALARLVASCERYVLEA